MKFSEEKTIMLLYWMKGFVIIDFRDWVVNDAFVGDNYFTLNTKMVFVICFNYNQIVKTKPLK